MDRILLTGFEPYGNFSENPSEQLVREFDRRDFGGYEIHSEILPVRLQGLVANLGRLVDSVDPIAIVSLGVAPGATTIRLERNAVNLAHFDIPDNEGETHRSSPLVAGGADGYFTTLPLAKLLDELLVAGIPAQISASAGTYLCNAVSYVLLNYLRSTARSVPCGFVHLPLSPRMAAAEIAANPPAQSAESPVATASMDINTQAAALQEILTVIAHHIDDRKAP